MSRTLIRLQTKDGKGDISWMQCVGYDGHACFGFHIVQPGRMIDCCVLRTPTRSIKKSATRRGQGRAEHQHEQEQGSSSMEVMRTAQHTCSVMISLGMATVQCGGGGRTRA